jgi:endonuclease YncB( thermonuclease family)
MRVFTPPNTHRARIIRFADADTVLLLIEGLFGSWQEKYVRLKGIESWELNGPDSDKAIAARNELNRLLENRLCYVHLASHGRDLYDRLRGRVTVGESDLATELVKRGLAWHCSASESRAAHKAQPPAVPQQKEIVCAAP